jgi:uncharacterized integral membrane protein (TIGR00697 family)
LPSLSPEPLIAWLNGVPPDLLTVAHALICFAAILVFLRFFGAAGLYAYIVVAILGANVQVLKPVAFAIHADPVALGTVLFSSTYLATDMLTEHYGRDAARRAVWIGFAAYLLWTVLMVLTLGFAPLTPGQAGEGLAWALPVQDAMRLMFTPAPALFAAGMIAYLSSQLIDIRIYQAVRRLTGDRHLWLRNNASTMISALIDNTVFSVFAWVVFAPEPMALEPLVFTYILGTYLLRVLLSLGDTPFMYLSRLVIRRAPPALDARLPA